MKLGGYIVYRPSRCKISLTATTTFLYENQVNGIQLIKPTEDMGTFAWMLHPSLAICWGHLKIHKA